MLISYRAQARGVLTWPRASARRGESLWSLVHRFLWLNMPNWRDLEQSFGHPTLHPFSLLYGVRRFESGSQPTVPFDPPQLARILGLTRLQWEMATLRWVQGSVLDDFVVGDIRYCPACLEAGYHSVAFQLEGFDQCPIHGHTLCRACPVCGQAISATLDAFAVEFPFACASCGHRLASGTKLIESCSLDSGPVVRALRWLRDVAGSQLVAPTPRQGEWQSVAFSGSWRLACLATVTPSPAPAAIGSRSKELRAWQSVRAQCGIRLTWKEIQTTMASGDEERRHTQIYKAYRRHLQKALSGRHRRLMRRFAEGGSGLWTSSETPDECRRRATAYAFLLFRGHVEKWPDIFMYGNAALCSRAAGRPFFARGWSVPRVAGTRDLQRYSSVGRWLADHLYWEGLRSQFAEMLYQAKAMATSGLYSLCPDATWQALAPYWVARRGEGTLEFQAWRPSHTLLKGDGETLL